MPATTARTQGRAEAVLGVALLSALLAGGDVSSGGGGQALNLRTPLIVAAAGYVIAAGLAWFATRPEG